MENGIRSVPPPSGLVAGSHLARNIEPIYMLSRTELVLTSGTLSNKRAREPGPIGMCSMCSTA